MNYPTRVLIAVDQLLATVFLGTMPDETISAMAHRRGWTRTEKAINALFRDPDHCLNAYLAELIGAQNARGYRKFQPNQTPSKE